MGIYDRAIKWTGLELGLALKILGLLLFAFAASLVPVLLVALLAGEPALPWVYSIAVNVLLGVLFWLPNRRASGGMKTRDGFLVTALVWVVLCGAAALVFYLDIGLTGEVLVVDAVFEAVSGFTTTGATVMTGLEELPRSLLLYRQMLQWMGGMGLLVLATAVLPALEIGGMQLRREMAGVQVSESIAMPSRFKRQARWLLNLYLLLTGLCFLAYWLAGMSPFDALSHSFTTVAIGGFSTRDGSIGSFDSLTIEIVCMVFILLATVNFALHFSVLRHRDPARYLQDAEFGFFIRWLLFVCALIGVLLVLGAGWREGQTLREGLFQAVSFATTTGYTTSGREDWPIPLVLVLVLAACVGGCSGSMAGGIKGFRVLIFLQYARLEFQRLLHPNAVIRVKLGATVVPPRALESLLGFLAIWVLVFLVLFGAVLATGLEPYTAFTAVAACLTNLGPGQGEVAQNYAELAGATKWVLALAMLLGRLEIFTLLVLFTPSFWRR